MDKNAWNKLQGGSQMLSWPEVVIIGTVALVFFGPKRLPEMAKSLGQGIKEFRKATTEGLQALSDKETTANPVCQSCNQPVADSLAKFCPRCGTSIAAATSP